MKYAFRGLLIVIALVAIPAWILYGAAEGVLRGLCVFSARFITVWRGIQ